MTMLNQIVGRVVAQLTRDALTAVADRDRSPMVVVDQFEQSEIPFMVESLANFRLPGMPADTRIVVASSVAINGVDPELMIDPGKTTTYYRNSQSHGLVLILVEQQSDRQSIDRLFVITDGDVLRDHPNLRSSLEDRLALIVTEAWEYRRPSVITPENLCRRLEAVFDALSSTSRVSLRQWVSLVNAICAELAPSGVVTDSMIDDAIGRALPQLGLFPDDELPLPPAELTARLRVNQAYARLESKPGKPSDEEELRRLIHSTTLRGIDGQPLESSLVENIRKRMRGYVDTQAPDDLENIQLRHWKQLFDRPNAKHGLGSTIRQWLETAQADRLEEFDDLAATTDLDQDDEQAALELYGAEPPPGQTALIDLLPGSLSKRVERLAVPRSQTAKDPLRAMLYGIKASDTPSNSDDEFRLSLESTTAETAPLSRELFALLYGKTLRGIETEAATGLGRNIKIDEQLLKPGTLAAWSSKGDDDGGPELEELWAELRLAVRSNDSIILRFTWRPLEAPGLIAFARRVVANGPPDVFDVESLAVYGDLAIDVDEPLIEGEQVGADTFGALDRWRELRATAFEQMKDGIDLEVLEEFVQNWSELLREAREALIPSGSPQPALDRFLDFDTAATLDEHIVMMATHPLRLRWFARHLRKMSQLIGAALAGELELNPENDQLFFDWIDRVSPHRQPALVSGPKSVIATAAREWDLHEEYAPIREGEKTRDDWLGQLDDASIAEMAGVAKSYLDGMPHKTDGLAVLLLTKTGDVRFADRFLRELRVKHRHASIELHVMSPTSSHQKIFSHLREFDSSDGRSTLLLPTFQLVLHAWEPDQDPPLDGLEGRIDIALAPNLFGSNRRLNNKTRSSHVNLAGSFDPWVDKASYLSGSESGFAEMNISSVLLPERPDPLLEAWSTLAVRRFTNETVADDPTNTDFFTIQIQFDTHAELFGKLHEVAHWVVTLDAFISREQIDALDSAPDVIVIKERVGKSEQYTMIVSSSAGREYVVPKLAKSVKDDLELIQEPTKATETAERLFVLGRNVAPSVMLRALGPGRSTEEVIGLVLTRFAIERLHPTSARPSVQWWLSLDDLTSWFGGHQKTRADQLQVVAYVDGDRLELVLRVVESKFRTHLDKGNAEEQVERTLSLLEAALSRGGARRQDSEFWRRELVSALSQTSRRRLEASELPAMSSAAASTEDEIERIYEAIRSGDYQVTFHGAICATATSVQGGIEHSLLADGTDLIRIKQDGVRKILDAARLCLPPSAIEIKRSDSAGLTDALSVPTRGQPQAEAGQEASANSEDAQERSQATADDLRVISGAIVGIGPAGLEQRYQSVLNVFSELGVRVDMPAGPRHDEGPGFYRLRFVPATGVAADKLESRTEDIKLRLGLASEQNIRSEINRGAVVFEVPKEDHERYVVDAEEMWKTFAWRDDALVVPLGEDISGNIVSLDFSSSDSPHLLLAGTTGAGKSVALDALLRGLCGSYSPEKLQLSLIDPKQTELIAFESSPHLSGEIGMFADEAVDVLQSAVDEMDRRYPIFKDHRVKDLAAYNAQADEPLPWRLVVLDEYADLTSDPDDKKRIEAAMKRLAAKARAAGIHVIVATQRPSADVVSSTLRSNLPAQLALRVRSATDSRIIMTEAGAEALAGKGDAFLRTNKGLTRLQCALYRGE